MKIPTKKKAAEEASGPAPVMRARFRAFSKLAEQAGEGRPLLRGLRVAHDPKADRFVVVHAGSRLEFVLSIPAPADGEATRAQVVCRRMDTAGTTEAAPIASFAFDETGVIQTSSIPELASERVDLAAGAWSVVAAVLWGNMHAQV
jgi:hypothetical protein